MREIMSTGWMSNRGRQNVASFLTKDLGIDWRSVFILFFLLKKMNVVVFLWIRYGAVWFESILVSRFIE
jgi:hypothetical protein